jgi:hypothetical protein
MLTAGKASGLEVVGVG